MELSNSLPQWKSRRVEPDVLSISRWPGGFQCLRVFKTSSCTQLTVLRLDSRHSATEVGLMIRDKIRGLPQRYSRPYVPKHNPFRDEA